MKKTKLINGIILGLSLILSVGIISVATTNADINNPGNNIGVYKPLNEGPDLQYKSGRLNIQGDVELYSKLTTSGSILSNSDIRGQNLRGTTIYGNIFSDIGTGYYVDPNSTTRLNNINIVGNTRLLGNASLARTNQQIYDTGPESLVNRRFVESNITPINNNINSINNRLNLITNQTFNLGGNSGSTYVQIRSNDTTQQSKNSDKDICALSRVTFDADNENTHPTFDCKLSGGKNSWTLIANVSPAPANGSAVCEFICFNID